MLKQIVKLSYKLCSIPSITDNEGEVLAYLSTWLSDQGFIVEKIKLSEERFNLLAYFAPHKKFSVMFCTHVDTVAPHIPPRLDDDQGILWGRGSCDAKGIAASMIFAALALRDEGIDDVALLLTVGEEAASDGAKACMPLLKGRADFLVVGEPTELRAASAQKGSLVFDLVAHGVEAHSSQPELGSSAVHKLIDLTSRMLAASWPDDPHFGETLLNFGIIDGGAARNALAKHARAQAIMRTSITNQTIIDAIKKMLGSDVDLNILSSQDPFLFYTPENFPTFLAAFGSDAPYLRDIGQVMLIGPGSLAHAHRPDEHIRYADLEAGMHAYVRIAKSVRKK